MPPKKTMAVELSPSSPMAQARLAAELRRALAEQRARGTILPSTLPPVALPPIRANETTASAINRAVEASIPPATTPAEQTARPGLIRRAIRAVTNRLAEALRNAGSRNRRRRGDDDARE